MPTFEQKMSSLRRAIGHCLSGIRWRNVPKAEAPKLTPDAGNPPDIVSSILDRTAADLRKLSASDEDFDARPIIDRAVQELGQLGFQSRPVEEALMDRYLEELPETDYQILRHFKQGMKHSEIAELMGTDVRSVRSSLIKTYSDLRMRMHGSDDGGGGLPAEEPPHSKSMHKPMKLTSLHP
ncbi:MAG TPA: sigma factor-like helix-turn-helix DNA-binding protein [Steroidobacter sp.]|uniref:sigma factor-like helix-turn-helix DNA-binding protein n=1 Tax=Steroidobacter sp. TaxID=1978227 RepID=UPI002EDAEF23